MKTKIHYVYKITNLNPSDERLFYIGVRSTTKPSAELDTNYRSSSKYLKEAIREIGHKNFKKEILTIWDTRELALLEEIRVHNKFDVAVNPFFYNKAKQTSTGFDTSGVSYNKNKLSVFNIKTNKHEQIHTYELSQHHFLPESKNKVSVIDLNTHITKQITQKEFQTNNYNGVTKTQITVRDIKTNSFKNIPIREFYKNRNNYTTATTGHVTVIEKETGDVKNISVAEFKDKDNDNYDHITKDTVSVIDKITGEKLRVSKIIYKHNDRYVNCRAKKINIYDDMGQLKFETYGDFKDICAINNLPFGELTKSYQKNKKIYVLNSPRKEEWFKYTNWYAKELN